MRTHTLPRHVGAVLLGAGLLAAPATALDLALWDSLLREYTTATHDTAGVRVDYAGLQREPRFGQLLGSLADAPPPAPGSRAELAFWINAYNVLAIRLVVDSYPVESIRDLGSLLRPVWKRPAGVAAGRPASLHQIEHEILRPLGDPRIHAAIVCASTSCPSLRRAAFRPEQLGAQLDEAFHDFVADSRKGARLDRELERLLVSKIFDWFEADFAAEGGVRAYLGPRLPDALASWLAAHGEAARLGHLDYDWRLNDWKRAAPGVDAQ
jgi:hypothetical protein